MQVLRLLATLLFFSLTTPAFAQLSETVSRPVGVYIFNPKLQKTDYQLLKLYTSDLTTFHMENADRQTVCKGLLSTQSRDWVFKNVNCFDGSLTIDAITLGERFKFGTIRHGLALYPLPDGRVAGVFLHLASESSLDSSATVSDEKIKSLYGEFPNWKIPQ